MINQGKTIKTKVTPIRDAPLQSEGKYDFGWIESLKAACEAIKAQEPEKAIEMAENAVESTDFCLKVHIWNRMITEWALVEKKDSKLSWSDAFEVVKRLAGFIEVKLLIFAPTDMQIEKRFKKEWLVAEYRAENNCVHFSKTLGMEWESPDEEGFGCGYEKYGVQCEVDSEGNFIQNWKRW